MSFENIKNIDLDNIHNRSCIMLVNFGGKELSNIKNISKLVGLRDIIELDYKNGDNIIENILEGEITSNEEGTIKNKAIIFNNIPSQKINGLLDNLKKMRINRPLSAMVTEQTIKWSLNDLIINLANERKAISEGKTSNHK